VKLEYALSIDDDTVEEMTTDDCLNVLYLTKMINKSASSP